MAMKQTQTKYFDCSDIGLEMCFGAVNRNPESFKKILTLGYNQQTVTNVSVVGNQVTFTYGGAHGYVADRVLKVDSGALASINRGEFWINSVTTNSVTLTIDDAPLSVASGFTTKVAPLGWDLVYEVGNIHIYKMLHLDDTNRYVRMCFETVTTNRASVAVCIGKTYDPSTGFINDPNALQGTKNISSPSVDNLPRWDVYRGSNSYVNYTYAQGLSIFGMGAAVGSKYHFGFQFGDGYTTDLQHHIFGIFPTHCPYYEQLDYPVLLAIAPANAGNSLGSIYGNFCIFGSGGHASIGDIQVRFDLTQGVSLNTILGALKPAASFLSSNLDTFNTTTLRPLDVFESTTSQYLGGVYGIYWALCGENDLPAYTASTSPTITYDTDLEVAVLMCASCANSNSISNVRVMALPIEEIRYVG